jgi:hypothetical protein
MFNLGDGQLETCSELGFESLIQNDRLGCGVCAPLEYPACSNDSDINLVSHSLNKYERLGI